MKQQTITIKNNIMKTLKNSFAIASIIFLVLCILTFCQNSYSKEQSEIIFAGYTFLILTCVFAHFVLANKMKELQNS